MLQSGVCKSKRVPSNYNRRAQGPIVAILCTFEGFAPRTRDGNKVISVGRETGAHDLLSAATRKAASATEDESRQRSGCEA